MRLDGKKVPYHVWWHFRGRWIWAYALHITAVVISLMALIVSIIVNP